MRNIPTQTTCSRSALPVLIVLLSVIVMYGQAQTTLTISGEVTKPLTLQAADLKAMPHTHGVGKDRDGKEHTYSGVPLSTLLTQAGATMGGELKGKNLSKFVLVKAIDGYEVLFALPELDPGLATHVILLADSVDGAPLPPGVGPYRVVVPDEKRPSRWIREVKAIEVRSAN